MRSAGDAGAALGRLAAACGLLAATACGGSGPPPEASARARDAVDRWCDRECPYACMVRGQLRLETEPEKALADFAFACEQEEAPEVCPSNADEGPLTPDAWRGPSCGTLAAASVTGSGGRERNHSEALRLALLSCDAAHAGGCAQAAALLLQGDVPHDSAAAAKLAEQGCERGSGQACYLSGHLHAGGQGVPVDPARAADRLRRACEGTERHAARGESCFRLARLLRDGEGVAADADEAERLAGRACKEGLARGCVLQAVLLVRAGRPADARPLALAACEAGDGDGCTLRGRLAEEGLGGPADADAARQLYRYGCQRGSSLACGHFDRLRGD